MLPINASASVPFALFGAAFLLALGLVFLFAPSKGLALTKHHAEDLPTIMAGRYFCLASLTAIVALKGSAELLAGAFFVLSALAFFDAAVYATRKKNVVPHLLAGAFTLIVPAIALGGVR